MSRAILPTSKALRALGALCLALGLARVESQALTPVAFNPVRDPLTNEIAILESRADLSADERTRLRALQRASAVLDKTSLNDGRALRKMTATLHRYPGYPARLDMVASNLVAAYTVQNAFVGSLIEELPETPPAIEVKARYIALSNVTYRLTNDVGAVPTSIRYDPAMRKLGQVFLRANQALLIPFPSDLGTNSVEAKIENGNGPKNFKVSSTTASRDLVSFQAVRSGDMVSVLLCALDASRGILFHINDVSIGARNYDIPGQASFTNRTEINFFAVPPTSTDVGATNGTISISATATEVYGAFSASGPGFSVTEGRFRINFATLPE